MKNILYLQDQGGGMFGQSDDQQQNQTHNDQPAGAPMPEPVADGSLGEGEDSPVTAAPPTMVTSSFDPASIPTTPLGDAAEPAATAPGSSVGGNDDLLNIKQEALQQLNPLVGHLDQSPEEKFRTTMMMIQASDNQALVKDAFESAKQISDDKARAQALLDIINEINYFTQQHNA